MVKHYIILIWICTLLLSCSINTGCLDSGSSPPKAITAMEKRSEADAKAREWNEDVVLIGVAGYEYKSTIIAEGKTLRADSNRGDGKCMMWIYEYHSISADKDYFVFVEADGDISDGDEYGDDSVEITNWHVDSDVASQVAQENNGTEFLEQYPNGIVAYFLDKDWKGEPYWSISYMDDQFEPEHYMLVKVNATSGVLISVQ
jgi:hypothetical protein